MWKALPFWTQGGQTWRQKQFASITCILFVQRFIQGLECWRMSIEFKAKSFEISDLDQAFLWPEPHNRESKEHSIEQTQWEPKKPKTLKPWNPKSQTHHTSVQRLSSKRKPWNPKSKTQHTSEQRLSSRRVRQILLPHRTERHGWIRNSRRGGSFHSATEAAGCQNSVSCSLSEVFVVCN